MRRSALLAILICGVVLTDACYADAGSNESVRFQIKSLKVGDSFALVRYQVTTGRVWFFSHSKNGWLTLAEEGEVPKGNYHVELVPMVVERGVQSSVAGIPGTERTEQYQMFRLNNETGDTWRYWKGSFKKIDLVDE